MHNNIRMNSIKRKKICTWHKDKLTTMCKKFAQENNNELNVKYRLHTQEQKNKLNRQRKKHQQNAIIKKHSQIKESWTDFLMTTVISIRLYLKFHVILLNMK